MEVMAAVILPHNVFIDLRLTMLVCECCLKFIGKPQCIANIVSNSEFAAPIFATAYKHIILPISSCIVNY
ncbi:hypothetical protein Fmac_029165 [Flemingia macrophylla]|uniref:Uncharacterized protein n=1 Tax=Flemingia macrophylla TaxID=520843 RepID=A0ABD1L9Q3_9FABA